jgi:hypothetical protein
VPSVADEIGKTRGKNQPKAMVVGNKNWKFEKFFYSIPHKDLRRKWCLHFCRFSHQTRR